LPFTASRKSALRANDLGSDFNLAILCIDGAERAFELAHIGVSVEHLGNTVISLVFLRRKLRQC
jgi:hypothetical protein